MKVTTETSTRSESASEEGKSAVQALSEQDGEIHSRAVRAKPQRETSPHRPSSVIRIADDRRRKASPIVKSSYGLLVID
jgi:hypothetical protein